MSSRKLVLAALCTMTGALVVSAAPALAATNNAYQSQFSGSLTAAGSFVPSALAVNSIGDVYVAAYNVVDEFNPEGTAVLAEFPGSKTKERSFSSEAFPMQGIAVNSIGDVYVADDEHNLVDEFNPSGTAVLAEFNGGKTAGGSFYPYPEALAVNSSGDVYVDTYNVVDEFSPPATGEPEPEPLAEFNGKKTAGESFSSTGLAVNSSGDVYVTDLQNSVVDEFSPPAPGESEPEPLRELKGSQTPQGSFLPYKVAVDPGADGDVYVTDAEHGVVDKFAGASGAYESQFEGGATPQGSFYEHAWLAAGPSGEVYVTGPIGVGVGVVDLFSGPVSVPAVTTGPAEHAQEASVTLTGSIEPSGGLEASCEFRYGTTSSYGSTAACLPAGPFSTSFNAVTADLVGLQPATTYHYRLESTTSSGTTPGADETFTTAARLVSPPTVSIKPVTVFGEHSATFSGEVNPNESATTYHFEYSSDGVWTPLKEENAGNGSSAVTVTQTVTGLTGHTPYRVRLVAVNSCGPGTTGCGTSTAEATFSTLAAPPQVSGTGATDISAGAATLHATIHPENNPTTYRFEYGPTASYGSTVPAGEGDLGASSTPTQVSQAIAGLSPDTTYHFRVLASNGVGAPTATPDQTFTTFSSAAAAGCPNEGVREESTVNPETGSPFSMQLPECRAYELVSPPLKNGASFSSEAFQGVSAGSIVSRVGSEGSTVLVASTGIWPGSEQQPANNDLFNSAASEGVSYKLTRGESGWRFEPEVPSALDLRAYLPFIRASEADMGSNGIWTGFGLAATESNIKLGLGTISDGNLYLLEPNGALAEIGPSVPPADYGAAPESEGPYGVSVQSGGASADLSRVLFGVVAFHWPFDQTKITRLGVGYKIPTLYEYAGTGHTGVGSDVPTLVGVDNTGALISQCGTEAGGTALSAVGVGPEARTISGGGSTVFFTALAAGAKCEASSSSGAGTGPLENQLFARVGVPGVGAAVGGAVTVNVAGTSECATGTFDSCNVTKAVSYQGASTDGSKVFFTSEQPLVAGDTDATNNLYECRLPGDSGAPLARMAPVDPCPDLVRVSIPVSGAGAGVQSVVAVSADGSHVYFTATGVLTGENAEHNTPTLGKDNLYVWQEPGPGYPQGGTAFIATLPSATLAEDEGGQATPDGDSFVFTSSADLTPDDTSTVNQVFLYEAQHEALIRVSKGQDGFNNDGNTTSNPARITTDNRRTISEDGSTVVFESSDALTAEVHGEAQHNVYLWRGGNVSLISDGTPAGESIRPALAAHSAGLVGIDASGENVFFVTEAHLVGQDSDDLPNLYDARVDGGFPAPKVDECIGEACQGAFSAPPAPVPLGGLSPSAQGNLTPTPKSAPKPTPKALTRSQKLAKALQACRRDRSKKKRTQCEAIAQRRFGAKHKAGQRKAGKRTGNGGK
jgi:hypothetical protein